MRTTGNNCTSGWKILQVFAAFLAVAWAGRVQAAPRRIVLPPETAGFLQGAGVELVMAHCLQCHSAEYITSQPLLGRTAWKASIDKMRGKYGAQIPAEQEAELLNYLVKSYGSDGAAPR
jgi:hypothetical protein